MAYVVIPKWRLVLSAALLACNPSAPAFAASEKARLTGLRDVQFGLISGSGDRASSQSVCAYVNSTNGYTVIANGDGSGGTFELTSGLDALPFEVRWADSADQSNGTQLSPGVESPLFTSDASQQTCNNSPAASATLTVVLRSSEIERVRAGNYSGSLQITMVPN